MTYEANLDLPAVLRATLSLLEHTNYPTKYSKSTQDLRKCLLNVLAEISAQQASIEQSSAED
jgi:hypothetical protein